MKKNRKFIVLIIAIILMVAIAIGCQATPNEEVIISKNSLSPTTMPSEDTEATSTLASNNSGEAKLTADWTSDSGKLHISVDAQVEGQQVNSWDSVELAPNPFAVEYVLKIIDVLFKDEILYQNTSDMRTKDDIETQIVELKEKKATDSDKNTSNSWKGADGVTTSIDEQIAVLENEYEEAPEIYNLVEIQREKISSLLSKSEEIDIMAKAQNDTLSTLQIHYPGKDNVNNELEYISLPKSMAISDPQPFSKIPRQLDITHDNALKMAQDFLDNTGFGRYKLSSEYLGNIYLKSLNQSTENYRISSDFLNNTPQCFIFRFSPEYGHLVANDVLFHTSSDKDNLESNSYAEKFKNEMIQIIISDDGIISVKWGSPAKNSSGISTTSQVIDADHALEFFFEHMKTFAVGLDNGGNDIAITANNIKITRIKLGTFAARIQNSNDSYRLIPVWDFYGNYVFDNEQKNNVQDIIEESGYYSSSGFSLLTINAIDGSIIDRSIGY